MRIAERMKWRARRWPVRPEGWRTLEEAAERSGTQVDPNVLANACPALTKGRAYQGFARIARPIVRMRRGHIHADERWFIHPDDADLLVAAMRGRLPHLRKGFLPPPTSRDVCGRTRPLVQRLMAMLEDAKSNRGTAESNGTAVEIRRSRVDGRPRCFAESEADRFDETLTGMHDAAVPGEVSRFTP